MWNTYLLNADCNKRRARNTRKGSTKLTTPDNIIKNAKYAAQELAKVFEVDGDYSVCISIIFPSQEVYDALDIEETTHGDRGLQVKNLSEGVLMLSVHNPRNKDK